jgi:hypothetical protein
VICVALAFVRESSEVVLFEFLYVIGVLDTLWSGLRTERAFWYYLLEKWIKKNSV